MALINGDEDPNSIDGTGGNDTINGQGGDDDLYGYAGDDTLDGGADLDILLGGEGNDLLIGGTGDDILEGDYGSNFNNTGSDTFDGGDGDDYMRGGNGVDHFDGGDGFDRISFYNVRATQGVVANLETGVIENDGFGNAETMTSIEGLGAGTAFADHFTGNDQSNLFLGDTGDTILAGDGDDQFQFGGGAASLDGGDGNDTITGFAGSTLIPDSNADGVAEVIQRTAGVTIYLWQGAGQLVNDGFGNSGFLISVENVGGSNFDDEIDGDGANNHLQGFGGSDTMGGIGGDDTIDGGDGDDFLFGDIGGNFGPEGNDTLIGGEGDDYMRGGAGVDHYEGGNGFDRISFYSRDVTQAIVASLADGTITNDGYGNAETFTSIEGLGGGGVFADFFEGDDNNNFIIGDAGDTLLGGLGDDQFQIGAAPAVLDGGDGNDTINSFSADTLLPDADDDDLAEYVVADHGVTVNLEDQMIVDDGFGNSAAIISIENVGGTDAFADLLIGSSGANSLWGGGGDDTLYGGAGNDTLFGGDDDDLIDGDVGEDLLTGEAGNDFLFGYEDNDVLQGELGDDFLVGGDGDDDLSGSEGDDLLVGQGGEDLMSGGEGNDRYFVDSSGDTVIDGAGEDTVYTALANYTLTAGVDNLMLTLVGNSNGVGNALDNKMVGSAFANSLSGGDGEDTIVGSLGSDTLLGGANDDVLFGDTGQAPGISLGAGVIVKGANAGAIDIDNAIDVSSDFSFANDPDIINSTSIPHVTVQATTDGERHFYRVDINNPGAAIIADVDSGAEGLDTFISLYDSEGNLVFFAEDSTLDSGSTTTDDATLVYPILTPGTYYLAVSGVGGAAPLAGGSSYELHISVVGEFDPGAADVLNGGAGADTMAGGLGFDSYVVDNVDDVIVEGASGGTDSVTSSVSYVLSANVENLTLSGTAAEGTGNASNNQITGNASANTLEGGAGNDTLIGGLGADLLDGGGDDDSMEGGGGDDNYVVDSDEDVVVEAATSGTDTVNASLNYTLGDNVENLILISDAEIGTGNTLNNVITGNSLANELNGGTGADTLSGSSGNDTLDGGAGVDSMTGSAGDDTFIVDDGSDVARESSASHGVDTVRASVTYTLGSNIENLVITGGANRNGVGNTLNNTITGNSGANSLFGQTGNDTLLGGDGADTLDGGGGVDSMEGGDGNDRYIVDSTTDLAVEASEMGGTDTVQASASFTLGANVENLVLTAAVTGTGNALNNLITGSTHANTLSGGAGDDTLDGGAGADSMTGSTGDDTFIVDNAGDVAREASAGHGASDTVLASVSYTIGANIENLTMTGAASLTGTGNTLDNTITGNGAADTLAGLEGDDSLLGGLGNDTLGGGSGNDTLDGGAGADSMTGSSGDDTFIVDNASDIARESSASHGRDTVRSSVTYTIGTNVENLVLTGSASRNGSGNTIANTITGNTGDNTLSGRDANDTLSGGGGNDELIGGVGIDRLTGGAGADDFVFNVAPAAANADVIVDFNVVDDRILLDNAFLTAVGADGALAAAAFRVGTAAGDATDRIIYNSATGALIYDTNGSGAGGAVQIATLSTGLALTAGDFLVI